MTATASRRGGFRPSPFLRDVLFSALTAAAVMASLVAVTGWLAAGLGPALFGVYALSRRLISAVTSFSTVPVGVALARALARSEHERDRLAYLAAGAIFVLVPNLILFGVGAAAPGLWARLLLSDPSHGSVLLATMLQIVAMATYTVVLARYRGTQQIGRANLWQLWALALGPAVVAAALASSGRVDLVVFLTAAVALATAIPVTRWMIRALAERVPWSEVRLRLHELMRYAIPRVPGGVAFGGLMAIGPFMAPYVGSLREAGFLVAGQSMLRVVEGGTSAYSLVALPKVATLQAKGQHEFLRDRVEDMISMVLHLGLFSTFQLIIWTEEIVTVWLGPPYLDATPIIRILMIAVVPYLAYAMLRAIIDGLDERAINTHNMYAACAVTAVLSLVSAVAGYGTLGLAAAGAAGFLVLGLMTVRHLWLMLRPSGRHLAAGAAAALNLLLAGAALGLRSALAERLSPGELLAVGFGIMGLAFAAYLMVLRHLGVRWVGEIERRLRAREGPR